MSCFFSESRNTLVLKCDGCGKTVDLYKGETDRLLKHGYMREAGWKSVKRKEKWLDICPECKTAIEQKMRAEFLEGMA